MGVFNAWTAAAVTRRLDGRLTYGATLHGSNGVETGLAREERRIPGEEERRKYLKLD